MLSHLDVAVSFLALRAAPDFLLALGFHRGRRDTFLLPLFALNRRLEGGETQMQKNKLIRANIESHWLSDVGGHFVSTHLILCASLRGHPLRLCSTLPQLKQPSFPSPRPHGWSGRAQRPQGWQCFQALEGRQCNKYAH